MTCRAIAMGSIGSKGIVGRRRKAWLGHKGICDRCCQVYRRCLPVSRSHWPEDRQDAASGGALTIGLLLASQGPDHAEFPAGNSRVRSFVAPLIHRHEPQDHFKIAAA